MRQPWDLPSERRCFHQRPKFIPPTRITEETTLESKGQLTQNGDLAQEFFIHLPLPQRAALLLKERERGGRTLHKVFLWSLPTAAVLFSRPFQLLSTARTNSPKHMFPHKVSGQVVSLISTGRRNQRQSRCHFSDSAGVMDTADELYPFFTGTCFKARASSINCSANSIYILLPMRPCEKGIHNHKARKNLNCPPHGSHPFRVKPL